MKKVIQVVTNLSCNLRCDYCYENKSKEIQSREAVYDFLQKELSKCNEEDEVNIDILGGESLLHVELCQFIIDRAIELNIHKSQIEFSICTNGTLLYKDNVRNFIKNNKDILNVCVSIDGTKEIHDKHRVYESGLGSYHDVIDGIKWLQSNIPKCKLSTKATFTEATFHGYIDTVMLFNELGIERYGANLTFETDSNELDILPTLVRLIELKDSDNIILPSQLSDDTLTVANNLLKQDIKKERNSCGSNQEMKCLGADGYAYGCNRFSTNKNKEEFRLETMPKFLIEDISDNYKKLDDECEYCCLQTLCSFCVASFYEEEGLVRNKRMCNWTKSLALASSYMRKLKG